MSESLHSTPEDAVVVPTPEELYALGVRIQEAAAALVPGGVIEQNQSNLNDDYEAASADTVKKQAEIDALQSEVEMISAEIADIISSMSNDDDMIPDVSVVPADNSGNTARLSFNDKASAEEVSRIREEAIRTRTDILCGRLISCKKKRSRLVTDIEQLRQGMQTVADYKDLNRQDERGLAECGVKLRQELSRLALVSTGIESILAMKPSSPRYSETYSYVPQQDENSLEGFINLGNNADEHYETIYLSVPLSLPVTEVADVSQLPVDDPPKSVLPPIPLSRKSQVKFLHNVTKRS